MDTQEIIKLKELEFRKQLIFAYLTCERLYPNYMYFSRNYDFGEPDELRAGIDYVYDNLLAGKIDQIKVDNFVRRIEKIIPEPADFETVLASSALDASTVVLETLNFGIDKNPSRLNDISTMATDSVHMYIQEVESLDYGTDSQFQQKIDNHPLMKREIATQQGIIKFLSITIEIDVEDIQTLLRLQKNNNKGNLDL